MEKSYEKHWEQILDMTQHPGWDNLLEDLKRRQTALTEGCVFEVRTIEELFARKGEMTVLYAIINLEQVAKETLKALEFEKDQDQ